MILPSNPYRPNRVKHTLTDDDVFALMVAELHDDEMPATAAYLNGEYLDCDAVRAEFVDYRDSLMRQIAEGWR